MPAESLLYDLFINTVQSFCVLTILPLDILNGFALRNAYFFISIFVSTAENADLLLGWAHALEILFRSDSKEHNGLSGK